MWPSLVSATLLSWSWIKFGSCVTSFRVSLLTSVSMLTLRFLVVIQWCVSPLTRIRMLGLLTGGRTVRWGATCGVGTGTASRYVDSGVG